MTSTRTDNRPSENILLLSLSLPVLLSSLGTSIANIALPGLIEAFSAPFQMVQWVVLAYLLAITTLIVSVGKLGDMIGRRRLLLIGIAAFTLASLLAAIAPTLGWMIAARALQGMGAATMMSLGMAMVAETVPSSRTGAAMGLLGTMSAIGTSLGPSLGGVLIFTLGWQAIFWIMAPLGMMSFWLVWRILPAAQPKPALPKPAFDIAGALALTLTLAAYALALTLEQGHWGPLSTGLLILAATGAAAFALIETKVTSPLIRLSVLRDRSLSAGLVMNALISTVMMATLVVGPFYLSRALGLNAVQVGLVMAIGPVISALSGVPAGRLADHLAAPSAVVTGLGVMMAGTLALCGLSFIPGLWGYIAALVILTPGYQLFQAANNTNIMVGVSPDQGGVISGMLNLSRNIGLITGASAMGAIFAMAAASDELSQASPEAVIRGLKATFMVATALIGMALGLALHGLAKPKTKPV